MTRLEEERVSKGLCPICGKDITDKLTLTPIKETKLVALEGWKVYICETHRTPI
jgi:hypothetical protein